MDVIEELKFLGKFTKKNLGGGGVGLEGGSGWVRSKNLSFWENSQKKKLRGGGWFGRGGVRVGGGGGVRVDVNEELKCL